MSALAVVEAGPTTTLQDGGRIGAARYGVPRSGPVDALSHRLAARLAGVATEAVAATVAIEVGPQPCTVAAVGGPVAIAVAGAGVVAVCDGAEVSAPCVLPLADGQRCTIRAVTWGYVVPTGDIDVPATLGSRSRHPRSGIGPAVGEGTTLALGPARHAGWTPGPDLAGWSARTTRCAPERPVHRRVAGDPGRGAVLDHDVVRPHGSPPRRADADDPRGP